MDNIDIVLNSNKELEYSDLESVGIDTSMIAVCKKLRRLAKLDRVTLDLEEHRSGLNKHLFDYFEFCGLEPLDAVKSYVSNLQPYMIQRRKDQEKSDSFICVVDVLYRVSVYIKVDSTEFEEVIISFHEDNKRGVAKVNKHKEFTSKYVPVFADKVLSRVTGENKYSVEVFVQRGTLSLPISAVGFKCKDVFIIDVRGIESYFITFCNNYIEGLFLSDYDLHQDDLDAFTVLEQLSFTSYGKDTFSTISLLIDSLCLQTNELMKKVADVNLITFVRNLGLTVEQRADLLELLNDRYRVSSVKNIRAVLEHISDEMGVNRIG